MKSGEKQALGNLVYASKHCVSEFDNILAARVGKLLEKLETAQRDQSILIRDLQKKNESLSRDNQWLKESARVLLQRQIGSSTLIYLYAFMRNISTSDAVKQTDRSPSISSIFSCSDDCHECSLSQVWDPVKKKVSHVQLTTILCDTMKERLSILVETHGLERLSALIRRALDFRKDGVPVAHPKTFTDENGIERPHTKLSLLVRFSDERTREAITFLAAARDLVSEGDHATRGSVDQLAIFEE